MTLTILLDRHDVADVAALYPAALDGCVLAYDLGAHFELSDRRIRHDTPWHLITPDDLTAARQLDDEVQAFWHQHAHIPFLGMDLLAMARHRHIACLTRMAWSAFVIHRALVRCAPTELVCLDDRTGHGLEQPPGCDAMPLLQPMGRGIAEQMKIPIKLLPRSRRTFVDHAAHASRDHSEPVDPHAILGNEPFVLFAGSGNDLLRQLPLIRNLRETSEFTAVQLYRSASADILRQLRAAGHHVWHESQVTQPRPCRKEAVDNPSRDCKGAVANEGAEPNTISCDSRVDDTTLHAARAAFDRARSRVPGAARMILANPHLDHHWHFIFGDYARRMSAHVATWCAFFERQKPNLIVANYPAPILEVGAHRNIPALILPHGIMTAGDARWYQSLPQVTLGAASPAHRRRIHNAGIPNERIALTGDPGMDATLRTIKTTTITRTQSDQPHILLVTSAIAAPAHQSELPVVDWQRAVKTFRSLSDLARRRADWQFTIKPHPRYDQTGLYQRLNVDVAKERRWRIADDTSLIELAAIADVIVVVNNRSSAIIEASLLKRPVYLLCGDMPGIDLAAWGLHHWPRLTSVLSLELELETLFNHPQYRVERAAQSARAAAQFLEEAPQISGHRCLMVIRALTANTASAAALT